MGSQLISELVGLLGFENLVAVLYYTLGQVTKGAPQGCIPGSFLSSVINDNRVFTLKICE